MIIRNSITALALWALFLAPFLCGLGVLTHSCICDDSSECRHELECSTDPCQIMALGSTSQYSRAGYSTISLDQLNPPALMDDVVDQFVIRHELVSGPADRLLRDIFPDRCLPLLC